MKTNSHQSNVNDKISRIPDSYIINYPVNYLRMRERLILKIQPTQLYEVLTELERKIGISIRDVSIQEHVIF